MSELPDNGNPSEIQEIISRADAKAAGLKFYYTGIPCKHGHDSKRYSSYAGCFDCAIAYSENQRKTNPEAVKQCMISWRAKSGQKIKAYSKKYYDENAEAIKAKRSEFYKKNREAELAKNAIWKKKNPAKNACNARRYLARKKGAEGNHTAEQIKLLHKKQNYKCAGCFCSIKESYHADHIVALANGGSNWISNIQLLCQHCNNCKHAKDPFDWALENGRLL